MTQPTHKHWINRGDGDIDAYVFDEHGNTVDSINIAQHVAPDNQPLITAAPKLLEALKGMVKLHASQEYRQTTDEEIAAINAIEEATSNRTLKVQNHV